MNLSGDLSELPSTSFVRFEAKRLARATLLWTRDSSCDERVMREAAFALPLSGDPEDAYEHSGKDFYADRYGGQGLGHNGGAARCGASGFFQVKGIGQTPLAGKKTNYFHSYGGATLFEAVLEAIWGNICELALPYGGARTIALIATGTDAPIKFPRTGGAKVTRRALAIREASLRPAHFMRSIYFRGATLGDGAILDAERTACALDSFPRVLRCVFQRDSMESPPQRSSVEVEEFGFLVAELLRRHASQLACARAKRIMHGSLTASNVTLSGGWIDYGSISTVSDYGPICIPRGAPHFMREELLLLEMLNDLCFYINKFVGGRRTGAIVNAQSLWRGFLSDFQAQLRVEFLVLLGLPRSFVAEHISHQLCFEMYSIIAQVISRNQGPPFTILSADNDYVPSMPAAFGEYRLNTLIQAVTVCQSLDEAIPAARRVLPDQKLADDFAAHYIGLMAMFISKNGGDPDGVVIEAIRVNALRLNTACSALFRTILYPHIEQCVDKHESISRFVQFHSDCARVCLADCDFGVPVTAFDRSVTFESGFVVNGVRPRFGRYELIASVEDWCGQTSKRNSVMAT